RVLFRSYKHGRGRYSTQAKSHIAHRPAILQCHSACSGNQSEVTMTPAVLLKGYALLRGRQFPLRFRQHLIRLNGSCEIGLEKLLCLHLPLAASTLQKSCTAECEKYKWEFGRWIGMCQAATYRSLISRLRVADMR